VDARDHSGGERELPGARRVAVLEWRVGPQDGLSASETHQRNHERPTRPAGFASLNPPLYQSTSL
jgi:hypothetical protein